MNVPVKNAWLISFVSLVLSFAALFISFLSLDRSRVDVKSKSNYLNASPTLVLTNMKGAKLKTQNKLITLRSQVNTNLDKNLLAQNVREIRLELADAYEDSSIDVQNELIELDMVFDQLEEEITNQPEKSLATIDNLITKLNEIETD